MSLSPESNLRIAQLRTRQLQGETLSIEELREAINLMRQARGQAAAASAASKSKSSRQSVKSVDSDALLDELGGV